MTNITEDTIRDIIANHEKNKMHIEKENNAILRNYQEGYLDGYHDALVNLLTMWVRKKKKE